MHYMKWASKSCSGTICNPCPYFKSLLLRFVISAPIWNLFAPIWNLFARFVIVLYSRNCFPFFRFFPVWYGNLNLNNFWDTFEMIPENGLGFNKFNPSHWWYYHLVLFWYWNSDMNNSWLSRSNDLISFKYLSCDIIIWSCSFLTTWYKASLNIKQDFSFVIVPPS